MITKHYLTKNDCYKAGRKIKPIGIMVHSTGAYNPYLKRYIGPDDGKLGKNTYNNDWNRPGISKCVHAFIGKLENGQVETYQTLPWDHRAWHGGKAAANDKYISFEMCEDNLTNGVYLQKVYENAVELCVYLCKEYNLDPQNIIGHYEGYQKGIASNHGDPRHWFSRHGKTMNDFRNDVKKGLGGVVLAVYRQGDKSSGVKKVQQDLIKLGFGDYMKPYGADGSFGAATKKAVEAFQKKYKLQVDGIAGPATQAKIVALLKDLASPQTDKLAEAKKLAKQILNL